MAANLAGMFQQMNQAINANPLGGETGAELLGLASQGLGGMMAGALGNEDRLGFMGRQGKQLEAQEQMRNLDTSTVEGLQRAAQLMTVQGKPQMAQKYIAQAEELKRHQMAQLKEGQEEIKAQSARTQAAGMAMQRGDEAAHKAIVGGFLEPEQYIAQVLDEDDDFTLSQGQVRFDPEGNEIARVAPRPLSGSNSRVPVFVERQATEYTNKAHEATELAGQSDQLATELDQMEQTFLRRGGVVASGMEALKKATGNPDAVSDLKIRYYRLRNSDAMNNLPPGAASDKDVYLALQGWPGDNAPLSQMSSFLRGMTKMQQMSSEYNNFMADYIGDNETILGANRAWRNRQTQESSGKVTFDSLGD